MNVEVIKKIITFFIMMKKQNWYKYVKTYPRRPKYRAVFLIVFTVSSPAIMLTKDIIILAGESSCGFSWNIENPVITNAVKIVLAEISTPMIPVRALAAVLLN
jgi:hypothetical protein